MNNGAGYAAGNLAVMSTQANRAKEAYDRRDAAKFVRQVEMGNLGEVDGLEAWARGRCDRPDELLHTLSHAEASHLPLLVLPPPRLRLLNPVQAVQAALTLCSRGLHVIRYPNVGRDVAPLPDGGA